jgi:putative heme iron utilization protein
VAGFGRIVDLAPAQVLTDVSGAASLLEAEQDAIAHMNTDHRDALHLYATKLLGAEPAEWRCSGCDPDGLDIMADGHTLRLDFPQRVTSPTELRNMLVLLAEKARAKP